MTNLYAVLFPFLIILGLVVIFLGSLLILEEVIERVSGQPRPNLIIWLCDHFYPETKGQR